jgi:hypothetical protein
MKKFRLVEEVDDCLNFKGFNIEEIKGEEVESEIIDKTKNTHLLIYGASKTGKTYFVKRYLEKNNIFNYKVLAINTDEWDHTKLLNIEEFRDINYITSKYFGYTIVIDDHANMKLGSIVSDLITKGRHFNIQLIFLAHLSTDLPPKSRDNVKEIYITTGNSTKFFTDLKTKFFLEHILSNFQYVEYGIIRYNLISKSFVVYDNNYKKIMIEQK